MRSDAEYNENTKEEMCWNKSNFFDINSQSDEQIAKLAIPIYFACRLHVIRTHPIWTCSPISVLQRRSLRTYDFSGCQNCWTNANCTIKTWLFAPVRRLILSNSRYTDGGALGAHDNRQGITTWRQTYRLNHTLLFPHPDRLDQSVGRMTIT